MLNAVSIFRQPDGSLPLQVIGARYNLAYKTFFGDTLCGNCAKDEPATLRGAEVNWNDPGMTCAACGDPIKPLF